MTTPAVWAQTTHLVEREDGAKVKVVTSITDTGVEIVTVVHGRRDRHTYAFGDLVNSARNLDVVLPPLTVPGSKISAIKAIRAVMPWGLRETKEMVDAGVIPDLDPPLAERIVIALLIDPGIQATIRRNP